MAAQSKQDQERSKHISMTPTAYPRAVHTCSYMLIQKTLYSVRPSIERGRRLCRTIHTRSCPLLALHPKKGAEGQTTRWQGQCRMPGRPSRESALVPAPAPRAEGGRTMSGLVDAAMPLSEAQSGTNRECLRSMMRNIPASKVATMQMRPSTSVMSQKKTPAPPPECMHCTAAAK